MFKKNEEECKKIEGGETLNNNDLLTDHNGIFTIIKISYALKTLKLIIVIVVVSYFSGVFFYIFSDLTNDIHSINDPSIGTGDNFIDDNALISGTDAY